MLRTNCIFLEDLVPMLTVLMIFLFMIPMPADGLNVITSQTQNAFQKLELAIQKLSLIVGYL